MKKILREYFTFNKRERNGVFVLLSIILILIIYLNISHYFIKPEKIDFTAFQKELAILESSMNKKGTTEELYAEELSPSSWKAKKSKQAERFEFDPNHLSSKDWERLGLSEKQIRSIRKFEEKGGRFRRKEDLGKMYCIPADQYKSLEPYIRIE